VRHELRIGRPPDDVWAVVGAPERLAEWFPGVEARMEGPDTRVVTTSSGLSFSETLLTVDRLQRRFQYRITNPFFREHLGTVDVIDLGDGTSLVTYAVDAEPSVMALVIGGAAGAALEQLRAMLEGS
jgi:uncharacterized protein YndB with AHSA1/START domain